MMIKKAQISHKEQIADLWNEAFGDKKEDILRFLEFLLKYFYVYEENDTIYAMAALLPISNKESRGGYIYAVATKKYMQGRGISTKLIKYIKNASEYDFFVLVPQNKSLFDFYKRFDFVPISCIDKKIITASSKICSSFSCTPISAKEYADFRKSFLGDELIEWDCEILGFAKSMYEGNFYEVIQDGIKIGACFCFKDGETLVIKELLAKDDKTLSKKLVSYFGTEKAIVSFPELDKEPSAMIFPANFDGIYFNIELD